MWGGDAFFGLSRDTGEQIKTYDIGTLLPLWAGFPTPAQAASLMRVYRTHFAISHPIPTVAHTSPNYNGDHWRGGVWPEMNYLIVEGMRAYGYTGEANGIIASTRALYAQHGPWEYYHPYDGSPAGYFEYIWGHLAAMPGY